MIFSAFSILVVIAIVFTVLALVWPSYPLLPVAVILLGVALLISPK